MSSSPTSPWPPVDRLGRPVPRQFTWITWLRAFPWLIEFFDQDVPSEYWSIESFAGDQQIVSVACPCGETPTVPETRCVECACGRFYLNAGERVLVARPEDVPAAVPKAATD